MELDDILGSYDVDTPLAQASTLPAAWYTDKRIAELERRAVFGSSWQLVGRTDQLREVGPPRVPAQIGRDDRIPVEEADEVLGLEPREPLAGREAHRREAAASEPDDECKASEEADPAGPAMRCGHLQPLGPQASGGNSLSPGGKCARKSLGSEEG